MRTAQDRNEITLSTRTYRYGIRDAFHACSTNPLWYGHVDPFLLENVQCCLDFLHAHKVQGLEQVTAVDIRDAKLKAVLALFFALSRHKQASKQRIAPPSGNAVNAVKSSNEDVSSGSVQRIAGGSSIAGDEVLSACGNKIEMTTLAANR
ncbi:unnamed protein product [Leptidea sinapis]|uniref:Calponin-homology (CH) domain-containing protein n=1 Tax=Leptidea sinapis TaxID=189913 RepID=A0A5E4Q0I6_9NEOP|nr:unnamed protein product [Leptidea sinapis]